MNWCGTKNIYVYTYIFNHEEEKEREKMMRVDTWSTLEINNETPGRVKALSPKDSHRGFNKSKCEKGGRTFDRE